MEIINNFEYDALSIEVWEDNYKGPKDLIRKDTWDRIAQNCAEIEKEGIRDVIKTEFKKAVYNDRFVPAGRILANLGIDSRNATTLFNCFVHNPADINLKDCDSIDGIYDMLKAQAKTLKSEGGYGINASWIRPAGSYVKGIGSRTPGVLKFMELWDKSSEVITQGSTKILGSRRPDEKNKIRKGAQMLVLNVWHPEILDFIVAKHTEGRLEKFNMSVGITEGFMSAVIEDKNWELKYPNTEVPEYNTEWFGDIYDWEQKGNPVIVYDTVKARSIWDLIMKSTYERAEPGVLFLDLANKLNPGYWYEKIMTTNPCGEVVMSTGACNLGSVNLAMFIKLDEKNVPYFDFADFSETVATAIRFLDNINDISEMPLPEYKKAVLEKRRIGVGVMGLGSIHIMLGTKYGSKKSMELTREIFKLKAETELMASALLGKEKGSYKLFDKEKYFSSYWWENLDISENIKKEIEAIGEMRNSHQSMNAPTGNTGIFARNVSGGIEPVFGKGFFRWSIVPEGRRRDLIEGGFKFPDISKSEWFETEHMSFSSRGQEQILKGTYKDKNYEIDKNRGLVVETFLEDYGFKFLKNVLGKTEQELENQEVYATAQNLSVEEHINVLKIAAEYTNMSVSKTVNVPNDYPYEEFKDIYLTAWKNNIKGITTYREGTRTAVLETKSDSTKKENVFTDNNAIKRPEILDCEIFHMQVKGEKWEFFIGLLDDRPYEVFAGRSEHVSLPKNRKTGIIKKNGTYNLYTGTGENELVIKDLATVFENTTESAFTRTISLALRHGVPVQYVCEQLEKGASKDNDMFSLSKGLQRVLKRYIKDGTKINKKICSECGQTSLVYQEGCTTCLSCGYSKCG